MGGGPGPWLYIFIYKVLMVFGEIIISKICTFTLPDWTEAELLSLEMELSREPLLQNIHQELPAQS